MGNKRIQDLPSKGTTIAANDILEVSEYQSPGVYTSKKILGSELGGVTSFEDLTDTFTFAGNELETVRVNAAGTALETYTPATSSTGRFGIADSSGVYTYYTTLTLAMTAATSGQTIEFFTDYTETGAVTITLKDGVNINGNGHTYTLDIVNNTTHAMLIDTSGTFRINNLTVRRINGGTSTRTLIIYNISGVTADIYGDGSYFYSSGGGCVYGLLSTINMYNIIAQTDAASQYSIYNEGNIHNCIGKGVGIGIGNSLGKVYDSVGISSGNKGMEAVTAYNCTGVSSSSFGILIPYGAPPAGLLSNCIGISSSSHGILNQKPGSIADNCSGYSSSLTGITFQTSGTTVRNCSGYSSSLYGIFISGGKLNNSSAYSSISYALYAENDSIISNNVIDSNGLHAAFLDASTNNAAQLMNNTFIVGNAAYNCLNATSAITIKYANNAFKGATTPVNANITQGVSNTHDSQGNILI